MPNLWYKNAVVYCLDVEKFMDANGDGIGDFKGLADRLDHLERLGVTCIWLTPFYPSPNRDNGYDVSDYYNVDPRYGTLGDFVEFMHAAEDRGIRVLIDLVVNHTSIEHPWFQSARSDENSPYRDWYVWSKDKPDDIEEGIVFPGVQKATWTYDRTAKAWYMHRFYKFQADLNIANREVCDEILKIMGFWLALGVSGFRIDAVPYLIENRGTPDVPAMPDRFALLSEMHDFMAWRRAESVLLAEANIEYDQALDYFEAGDRMSMVFDFMLNQNLFLSLARNSGTPLRRALKTRPDPTGMGQWAVFLRNHDELDLARLTQAEQEDCFEAFGPDPDMQIYNRGLRRRLASMFNGNQKQIRLAFSLMFSLPGTPVIWFGEEIGMGENLDEPEREAVRTPMQWSHQKHAGFSSASNSGLVQEIPSTGQFGCEQINVARQVREPGSQFHAVAEMIRTRRSTPEIGWGKTDILDVGNDDVLVLSHEWEGNRVVTAHNLSNQAVSISIEVDDVDIFLPSLSSMAELTPFAAGEPMKLEPHGYCWLRCDRERR